MNALVSGMPLTRGYGGMVRRNRQDRQLPVVAAAKHSPLLEQTPDSVLGSAVWPRIGQKPHDSPETLQGKVLVSLVQEYDPELAAEIQSYVHPGSGGDRKSEEIKSNNMTLDQPAPERGADSQARR
jgi:hypothetical protein